MFSKKFGTTEPEYDIHHHHEQDTEQHLETKFLDE